LRNIEEDAAGHHVVRRAEFGGLWARVGEGETTPKVNGVRYGQQHDGGLGRGGGLMGL